MGKPFTPERLARIRRMRKARRLYRAQPLFAFEMMQQQYPAYTYQDFCDDLRYRKKPKRRKGKSFLKRFGRYARMEQLNEMYHRTGNIAYAVQAQRLRKHMTKPYRILVRIDGDILEYGLSALVRIEEVERLTNLLPKCKTQQQADTLMEQFRENSHIN